MIIGIPKEVKNHEYRMGLVPSSVRELIHNGHKVVLQSTAGDAIGFGDATYQAIGAEILPTAEEVFQQADMIIKVKEPQAQELEMLRENQILFTFLHLAPDPSQTNGLMDSKCVAIAYETVTDDWGGLPLLAPMSEVAGRMSVQVGARALEKEAGGAGILLGGVPGVSPGKVTIIGGGVVGMNAVRMATGLEAEVTVIDLSSRRLRELDVQFGSRIKTIMSTVESIEQHIIDSDLVIGAVLVPGAAAPRLVNRSTLQKMRQGSVMVDVAIDQGGCFETSRPTTHTDPMYVVDGVVHYCVTNMPGAVPRTSAVALSNVTLPYVLDIANKGYRQALLEDKHLRNGLNVCHGAVTHQAVAEALGHDYVPAETILQQ